MVLQEIITKANGRFWDHNYWAQEQKRNYSKTSLEVGFNCNAHVGQSVIESMFPEAKRAALQQENSSNWEA